MSFVFKKGELPSFWRRGYVKVCELFRALWRAVLGFGRTWYDLTLSIIAANVMVLLWNASIGHIIPLLQTQNLFVSLLTVVIYFATRRQ